MNQEQIVIAGSNGQLGRALSARWPGAVAVDVGELDFAEAAAVEAFAWSGIRLVINAPRTPTSTAPRRRRAVRRLEGQRPGGRGTSPGSTIARGITLVHVGTDYVFDGSRAPYAEEADLAPLGAYGASKAAGDVAAGFVPGTTCCGPAGSSATGRTSCARCSSWRGAASTPESFPTRSAADLHRGAGARHRPPARHRRRYAPTTSATAAPRSPGRTSRAKSTPCPGCPPPSPTSRPPSTRRAPAGSPPDPGQQVRSGQDPFHRLRAAGLAPGPGGVSESALRSPPPFRPCYTSPGCRSARFGAPRAGESSR